MKGGMNITELGLHKRRCLAGLTDTGVASCSHYSYRRYTKKECWLYFWGRRYVAPGRGHAVSMAGREA